MKEYSSKSEMPSNIPDNGNVLERIYAKPASEVADEFERLLLEMDEDDFDPALVDIYLDVLDKKVPMPEMPSKEESYNSFNHRLLQIKPECTSQSVLPDKQFRRIKLAGLVAIISTICVLSIVAVAQAAGIDVWGKIVSLTDEIFSFGTIRSEGSKDENYESEEGYETLQEMLDMYQVAEINAPTWIPEGYVPYKMDATCSPTDQLFICAEYSNGTDNLLITVMNYDDEPTLQVEKTLTPSETFALNNSTVYLLENNNNNIATWVTENYQCSIVGTVDKEILQQIVLSTQTT